MLKLMVCLSMYSLFTVSQIGLNFSWTKFIWCRNKLKCIKVNIEEKVAQALNISAEELQPET